MAKDKDTSIGGFRAAFPTTQWSFVLNASDRTSQECVGRVNRLMGRYWKPIYRTIRLGWGRSNEDAKDLTQGFLASLVERKFWVDVHPSKGRFRYYLKAALKHYLLNADRDASRQKRGGGEAMFSIDALEVVDKELDLSQSGAPDDVFDREWASEILEEAIDKVEEEMRAAGKDKYIEVFLRYDVNPPSEGPPTYKALADELSIGESDVRNYLAAVRAEVRKRVIARISEYALSEEEIYQELNELLGGGA